MVTPWISSRNGEKERKRGERRGRCGKEGKRSYRLKIIAFTPHLPLSLSRVRAEYLYLEYTPSLPSPLSRSLFNSQASSSSAILLRIYISLILNQARAIRAKAFAGSCDSLTLCFSTLANAEIYTLQFRIVGISRPWYGFWKSRFGKAESSYLLRDLCSPLFDNSPSFQNI